MGARVFAMTPKGDHFELIINDVVLKITLDSDGAASLPEHLEEHLPHYVPEMVEKLISSPDRDEEQRIAALHENWCDELKEKGACNCAPLIDEPLIGSNQKMICVNCGKSSSGELTMNRYQRFHQYLRLYRLQQSDICYWSCEEEDKGKIFCEACFVACHEDFSEWIDHFLLENATCKNLH